MSQETVTVHDEREPGWFWVDNELLDAHAKQIGPIGIAAYCVLAKHAVNAPNRTSWPSYQTIANQMGCSRVTAIKAVQELERLGLITREVRRVAPDQHTSNLYSLTRLKGGGKGGIPGVVKQVNQGSTGAVPELDPLNKTTTNNPGEDNGNVPVADGFDPIAFFLKAFGGKRLNPTQKQTLQELHLAYPEHYSRAVIWSANQGMAMGNAIVSLQTALPKWSKQSKGSGPVAVSRQEGTRVRMG